MSKGDQLKWQSLRFAFEWHRDRYPDTQLGVSLKYFHCQFQRKFVVPNRKGWRIEKCTRGISSSGRALDSHSRGTGSRHGYSNWLFFTIIFIANFNASLLCQTEKVEEQKIIRLAEVVERSIRIREPGSIPGFSNQFFFTIIFVANCNTSFCAKQKSLENRKMQGRLAQVVERSIRIREAPGSRHGYSNWLFFTIIFIANFNASLLCQTEKVEEQKQYFQGDQLKWQSAKFAFERHRDRDTDTPIGYSLQLFSLPISTQVCCATQKRLENRKIVQGELPEVVERSFAFERHRDRCPDSPISFSLQLFSLPIATQVFCAKQKRLENRKNVQVGISSSGRALDSHSRGTGIDTRILQLVFLYNYFHCQFQRKFFVPNRKGWRIEKMCKGDQLKWQSARFAFERHRDRDTDTPIGYSLQLFSLPISTQVCCAKQKSLEKRNKCTRGIS